MLLNHMRSSPPPSPGLGMDHIFETEQKLLNENHKLLSDQSLSHLRKYHYNGVDKSILAKLFLNDFWNSVAEHMPPYLAPNVITLIGISAILVGNFFVYYYQDGDLFSAMPRWVYLFQSLAFLFYQTMDNVDGKQARKTGTSSPLGELFDHGIDSLNCLWGALLMVSSLGQGSTWPAVITLLSPLIGMYFSTWETYYTKTLFLDVLNAPTEGLVVAALVHFLTFLFGPEIWSFKIYGTTLPLGMLWTIPLLLTVVLMHIPACVQNVYQHDSKRFEESAVPNLWPLAVLCGSVLLWLSGPNSTIVNDADPKQGHLFLFGWGLAFTFGRVSTTVILSHLCNSKFPKFSFPVCLLILGASLYGVLPYFGINLFQNYEYEYLWVYTFVSGVYFVEFSHLVIDRITNHLGIRAFTIEKY